MVEADHLHPQSLQPPHWPTPKGYSHAMAATGRLLALSGQFGCNAQGRIAEGLVAQTRQALENIATLLEQASFPPRSVIRLGWYLIDMDDYARNRPAIGRVYRSIFGYHYPAMTLVQVSRLLDPGALVEIEAVAAVSA